MIHPAPMKVNTFWVKRKPDRNQPGIYHSDWEIQSFFACVPK